jgi:hypothetical protein
VETLGVERLGVDITFRGAERCWLWLVLAVGGISTAPSGGDEKIAGTVL